MGWEVGVLRPSCLHVLTLHHSPAHCWAQSSSLPHSQFQGLTAGLTLPCPLPTLNALHRQDEPEFANPTEIIHVSLSKGGLGVGAVFPKECKGFARSPEHHRALR